MFEWIPILSGFSLGGLSILASRRRTNHFYVCAGILLIALDATFLSGEWQQSRMYLAIDVIEAVAGFATGTLLARTISRTQLH
jgi:hypothetical protein